MWRMSCGCRSSIMVNISRRNNILPKLLISLDSSRGCNITLKILLVIFWDALCFCWSFWWLPLLWTGPTSRGRARRRLHCRGERLGRGTHIGADYDGQDTGNYHLLQNSYFLPFQYTQYTSRSFTQEKGNFHPATGIANSSGQPSGWSFARGRPLILKTTNRA